MSANAYFPYDTIRQEQDKLVNDIYKAIAGKKSLIAHAPTGLGKTAAALAPALHYALANNKTVFFLTSRHTQHHIAIETLRAIKNKHSLKFSVADMLGKKHMCAREDAAAMFPRQFYEYCKTLRENEGCGYFENFRKKGEPTDSTKKVIAFIQGSLLHSEETVKAAKELNVCPFEAAALAAREAAVVIADYSYAFNPTIRESFFKRNLKALKDAIIIVDEAHSLPDRLRDMLTDVISLATVERAMKETEKLEDEEITQFLTVLRSTLNEIATNSEQLVTVEQLLEPLEEFNLERILSKMATFAENIRISQRTSFLGSVAEFLTAWQQDDEGYARIIKREGQGITLSFCCLDPSLASKAVIDTAHSVILMSGTLTPTELYCDLLGFPETVMEHEYANPMPKKNRLALIVQGVTTQYQQRTERQFENIAAICTTASKAIPGNVIFFFPSYELLNRVHRHLDITKKIIKERPGMTKDEKKALLTDFKNSHLTGAILLAVIGGSFSEGIDLPDELLNGVAIIGLPLGQPDLHTKSLIAYYQQRFGRGWDYGYVFPAFTKALQSAGRCIRSETDRGVILFVDERYAWEKYYACFPKDIEPKLTAHYEQAIKEFFPRKDY